jgi:hypothetical protein
MPCSCGPSPSHLNDKDVRDQNQVFTGMPAFGFAQLTWSMFSHEPPGE